MCQQASEYIVILFAYKYFCNFYDSNHNNQLWHKYLYTNNCILRASSFYHDSPPTSLFIPLIYIAIYLARTYISVHKHLTEAFPDFLFCHCCYTYASRSTSVLLRQMMHIRWSFRLYPHHNRSDLQPVWRWT